MNKNLRRSLRVFTTVGLLLVSQVASPSAVVASSPVPSVAAGSITPVVPGVPAGASAVMANLTMVDGSAPGYITADKCSLLVPAPQSKSNGNHAVTAAIANLSVVPLDPDGRFCIYNQQPVDLVADVQGFFAPPSAGGQVFTSRTPTRLLDTRKSPMRPSASFVTRVTSSVPPGTTALLVNLTMVDGLGAGYITADTCQSLVPGPQSKSNGNHGAALAIANLSVVPVDADGSFCIYNQQAVNLVVDLQGFFSATAPSGLNFTPVVSSRKLDTRIAPSVRPTSGTITRVETGVAANTAAVLVNLTMVDGVAAGFITADKCSVLAPGPQSQSNGNHDVSIAISNLAVVPVDADGSFCIYNQQAVNLVVDIQGAFSASGAMQFFPTGPNRVLDTR